MQHDQLHAHVRAVYARAGFDPAAPRGPIALARAILGRDGFVLLPRPRGRKPCPRAHLVALRDRWELRVDDGLPNAQLSLAVADGLARWYALDVLRARALPRLDRLGEHLVLPEPALEILAGPLGYSAREIALAMALPEPRVAARLAAREAKRRARVIRGEARGTSALLRLVV